MWPRLAEIGEGALALWTQRAYRAEAEDPWIGPIKPRSQAPSLRDVFDVIRFRRKVRHWKTAGVRFGRGVIVMPSAFIDTQHGWMVSIGDRTRIAEQVRILVHDASPQRDLCWGRVGPVTIGRDCVLNERVIVLAGVTIGDGCLIGSGSVVATDIPAGSRAMGVPARVYGTMKDYWDEMRRALSESPRFAYHELFHLTPEQREAALARIRAAGNRGFYYDPFSFSPWWATPPEE